MPLKVHCKNRKNSFQKEYKKLETDFTGIRTEKRFDSSFIFLRITLKALKFEEKIY